MYTLSFCCKKIKSYKISNNLTKLDVITLVNNWFVYTLYSNFFDFNEILIFSGKCKNRKPVRKNFILIGWKFKQKSHNNYNFNIVLRKTVISEFKSIRRVYIYIHTYCV